MKVADGVCTSTLLQTVEAARADTLLFIYLYRFAVFHFFRRFAFPCGDVAYHFHREGNSCGEIERHTQNENIARVVWSWSAVCPP